MDLCVIMVFLAGEERVYLMAFFNKYLQINLSQKIFITF